MKTAYEAVRRSWTWVLKGRQNVGHGSACHRGADISEGTHAGEDICFDWRLRRSEGWLEKQMVPGHGCLKL